MNMLSMRHALPARPWLVLSLLVVVLAAAAAAGLALRARAAADDDWPDEGARLVRVLAVGAGATVAEIGAGRGELTVEVARQIGPTGRLYSTEIDAARRDDIQRAAEAAALANVTVVAAGERDTNLPEACCDAVYMREVFHHFGDKATMAAALRRAIKPGGRLGVIDYPLRSNYGGDCHCIDKAELIRIVTAAGFAMVHEQDRWAGIRYLLVFRRGPA
jgi:predicted methyltransferase